MTFSKSLLSNSLPPGKNVRSNITKFPTQRNDLWSRARTKIQISLPPGQQENSNVLLPGQSDRSKSRPMPHLPPSQLDIDRCIMRSPKVPNHEILAAQHLSLQEKSNLFACGTQVLLENTALPTSKTDFTISRFNTY